MTVSKKKVFSLWFFVFLNLLYSARCPKVAYNISNRVALFLFFHFTIPGGGRAMDPCGQVSDRLIDESLLINQNLDVGRTTNRVSFLWGSRLESWPHLPVRPTPFWRSCDSIKCLRRSRFQTSKPLASAWLGSPSKSACVRAAWRFLHWGYAVLHPDQNAIFQIRGKVFTSLLLLNRNPQPSYSAPPSTLPPFLGPENADSVP